MHSTILFPESFRELDNGHQAKLGDAPTIDSPSPEMECYGSALGCFSAATVSVLGFLLFYRFVIRASNFCQDA